MHAHTAQLTYAERKIRVFKYIDTKGDTISFSTQHEFWIVDDGKKFFTIAGSQHSIELSHPVKTILAR